MGSLIRVPRHRDRGSSRLPLCSHPRTRTWTPAVFAIFSLGVFVSVPDTEESLVLLGVSLPLALLSFPDSRAGFGVSGAYAALGVAMWVIVQGELGRPAAIIGASAGLGLLLADPIARLLSAGHGSLLDRFPYGWGGLVLASFAQLLLVVGVARTAGLVENIVQAVLVGAAFVRAGLTVLLRTLPFFSGLLIDRELYVSDFGFRLSVQEREEYRPQPRQVPVIDIDPRVLSFGRALGCGPCLSASCYGWRRGSWAWTTLAMYRSIHRSIGSWGPTPWPRIGIRLRIFSSRR